MTNIEKMCGLLRDIRLLNERMKGAADGEQVLMLEKRQELVGEINRLLHPDVEINRIY